MKKYDLEERLIAFSVLIIDIVNEMINSKAGNHLAGQIIRSGTSQHIIIERFKVQNQEKILFIK